MPMLLITVVSSQHVFDYQDGEVFGCVADIGWITGHSYVVYGPLSNGATTLLFESTPIYPNPGRGVCDGHFSNNCSVCLCRVFNDVF